MMAAMRILRKAARLICLTFVSVATVSGQAPARVMTDVDTLYPDLSALYEDLHRNPELGFQETRTAATLAARLKALGFEVTTGVGKTGIVALLRNGAGPTAMLRTELDALPVEEKTGVAFASKATAKNAAGQAVSVMHACGHDLHMTAWIGTATWMATHRDAWRGTLMLVGQPAEESVSGAAAMLKDGLFTKFPKPARGNDWLPRRILPGVDDGADHHGSRSGRARRDSAEHRRSDRHRRPHRHEPADDRRA
jgi:hypothetical protein